MPANVIADAIALDEGHREPCEPFTLVHAEYRDDVRMIQPRSGLRLTKKTLPDVGAECEIGRKNLERDAALQPPVVCLVDNPGSAASELAHDFVRGLDGVRDTREKFVFWRRRRGQLCGG